ncbi:MULTISPECIES: hypothetical protein [unclassified Rhodanobacter]|nr:MULTISPECIES: hypothetical protein [unclassified Rhodanobacter]
MISTVLQGVCPDPRAKGLLQLLEVVFYDDLNEEQLDPIESDF